eukprot:12888783-Alexandrium_andersonii.AAC.1
MAKLIAKHAWHTLRSVRLVRETPCPSALPSATDIICDACVVMIREALVEGIMHRSRRQTARIIHDE